MLAASREWHKDPDKQKVFTGCLRIYREKNSLLIHGLSDSQACVDHKQLSTGCSTGIAGYHAPPDDARCTAELKADVHGVRPGSTGSTAGRMERKDPEPPTARKRCLALRQAAVHPDPGHERIRVQGCVMTSMCTATLQPCPVGP